MKPEPSTASPAPLHRDGAEVAHLPSHWRGGYIVWLTGLSGAGKSTLSRALKPALGAEQPAEILAGDEVRAYLSKGLGFSKEDRDTNVHRIGYVARVPARNGVAGMAAAHPPYAAVPRHVRER